MDKTAKYTPGPWNLGTGWVYAGTPKEPKSIAADFPGIYRDDGTAEANARLIAAAPDLLEAAKRALERLGENAGSRYESEASKSLRAAIVKAEGR